ncbi:hypothetical protein [Vibrio sp. HENC-03]|uniref:hypothetical protein n=1 Tax=Vibrio sp. HENC-03 TaxID=992012 RepID=UPI0005192E9B|nr:hypothetical protein [Vibrio sp. HENC-03]
MNKEVEFLGHRRAFFHALLCFVLCFFGWHVAELGFPLTSGWQGYAGLFLISALVYGYSRVTNESNLKFAAQKVLFMGQPASLKYKKLPIVGPSILIRSSSSDGKFRTRVYRHWVSSQDWEELVSRCT